MGDKYMYHAHSAISYHLGATRVTALCAFICIGRYHKVFLCFTGTASWNQMRPTMDDEYLANLRIVTIGNFISAKCSQCYCPCAFCLDTWMSRSVSVLILSCQWIPLRISMVDEYQPNLYKSTAISYQLSLTRVTAVVLTVRVAEYHKDFPCFSSLMVYWTLIKLYYG